jgi:uncharacterized protein YdiU (UPF0061 family)
MMNVMRSSIREYVASGAMEALGVSAVLHVVYRTAMGMIM